jgi:hypothetical protein
LFSLGPVARLRLRVLHVVDHSLCFEPRAGMSQAGPGLGFQIEVPVGVRRLPGHVRSGSSLAKSGSSWTWSENSGLGSGAPRLGLGAPLVAHEFPDSAPSRRQGCQCLSFLGGPGLRTRLRQRCVV